MELTMTKEEPERYCLLASQTVEVLQGKWKMQILCLVRWGPVRLGQLGRLIPSTSKKVLIENLRELESHGLIVRRDLSGTIRHVEYDFTEVKRPAMIRTTAQNKMAHRVTHGPSMRLRSIVRVSKSPIFRVTGRKAALPPGAGASVSCPSSRPKHPWGSPLPIA